MKTLSAWMLLGCLAGCATPMTQVQGQTVYKQQWSDDQAELARRSQFDLSCGQAPNLTLLKVSERTPTAIGVEACGRRATYMRSIDAFRNPGTWMLNASQPAGAEQKPQ